MSFDIKCQNTKVLIELFEIIQLIFSEMRTSTNDDTTHNINYYLSRKLESGMTNRKFKSKNEMDELILDLTLKDGFYVSIRNSRPNFVSYECSSNVSSRSSTFKNDIGQNTTVNCPFKMNCSTDAKLVRPVWKISDNCNFYHNHPPLKGCVSVTPSILDLTLAQSMTSMTNILVDESPKIALVSGSDNQFVASSSVDLDAIQSPIALVDDMDIDVHDTADKQKRKMIVLEPIKRVKRNVGAVNEDSQYYRNLIYDIEMNANGITILPLHTLLGSSISKPTMIDILKKIGNGNTSVQAMYLQNNSCIDDEVIDILGETLVKCPNIWGLNLGELDDMKNNDTWNNFFHVLQNTNLSCIYFSDYYLSDAMKAHVIAICRENRKKPLNTLWKDPNNWNVVKNVGNMWWNPRVSKYNKANREKKMKLQETDDDV